MHETRNRHDPRTRSRLAETREEERDEEVRAEVVTPDLGFEAFRAATQVESLWDHYVLHENLFDGK